MKRILFIGEKKSQSNNNTPIYYSAVYLTKNRYKISEENKNLLRSIKEYIYMYLYILFLEWKAQQLKMLILPELLMNLI